MGIFERVERIVLTVGVRAVFVVDATFVVTFIFTIFVFSEMYTSLLYTSSNLMNGWEYKTEVMNGGTKRLRHIEKMGSSLRS